MVSKKPTQMAQQSETRPNNREIKPDSTPEQWVAWSLERFANQRLVITTSFGMEGCALIDMFARHKKPITVIYIDTKFFFPETYVLRDRLQDRYPHMAFENHGTTLTAEEQDRLHGPELWKRDPDLCCRLRKVGPMVEAMSNVDVWATALTRRQSATRKDLRILDWDMRYQVLKFSPLASWDRAATWQYIQANDVPYNTLHEQGYPTLGCAQCTRPVPGLKIGEYSREGRWSGISKTECGLHGDGI